MPRRADLSSILVIGAGPIVIGQACEFDYSGTQAVKALKKEGYRTILVNSNPASIMTDPGLADRTYIEPLTPEFLERIIELERPSALISTMGGQTSLNLTMKLHETGVLERYGVEVIGAGIDAIRRGEDREAFREVCRSASIDIPRAKVARSIQEGITIAGALRFPVVLRPAFTLGGSGGGIATDEAMLRVMLAAGIAASPVGEVLVEESVGGWKEFELEVMRDAADRCVVVCSIENIDSMGVHTGDSVTVAPALTLSDPDYQRMRDAAFAIMRGVGVETGGANVQFALERDGGRLLAIEMNPRVSRSSALASKATGFPIAKIAALLAVGYLLDEITNDITGKTKAAFEPALDYVVTKIPRFAFEKFKEADQTLTTSMKSVGEVMAIGRSFPESLQKAVRGLEIGRHGLGGDGRGIEPRVIEMTAREESDVERATLLKSIVYKLETPNCDRLFNVKYALMLGLTIDEVAALSRIDRFFVGQIARLVDFEERVRRERAGSAMDDDLLDDALRLGYSASQLAYLIGVSPGAMRAELRRRERAAVYKCVDTCAGEFAASTPYYYGTRGEESEIRGGSKPRIMLLGSGPNRIGQGIEFDCCLCHASAALRDEGYEAVMVNSNPETVSTDYDTSDLLFFDPVVADDVIAIHDAINPRGAIVSMGGQTPLSIAREIESAGVRILGTSVASIDRAEDRRYFTELAGSLGIALPRHAVALDMNGARASAEEIGFPVLVRPSYVLGGRAMMIAYDHGEFEGFAEEALEAAEGRVIQIDQFLDDAVELDVDAICDGRTAVIAGIMEHVEPAGVHSGDSAAVFPAFTMDKELLDQMAEATRRMALELKVVGLLNVQYAVKDGKLFVLEANPRASRTIPFLEKATGVDWSGLAARVMLGRSLAELGVAEGRPRHGLTYVKEVVLPFNRFEAVDVVLTPEMKSTGEVMGIGRSVSEAFLKAQWAAGNRLPRGGGVLITVADRFKESSIPVARRLAGLGHDLYATAGTAAAFRAAGIAATVVEKIGASSGEIFGMIATGRIRLVINLRGGYGPSTYARRIDRAAIQHGVPVYSMLRSAQLLVDALEYWNREPKIEVFALQGSGDLLNY